MSSRWLKNLCKSLKKIYSFVIFSAVICTANWYLCLRLFEVGNFLYYRATRWRSSSMASQDKNRPPSPPVPGPSSSGILPFHFFIYHLIGFVRLDLDPLWECGSRFRRAKMTYKNGKKLQNSCFVLLDFLF